MSEQKLLPFDDLEWTWEAKRSIFGWLSGDVHGFVWYRTRAEAEAAASKPPRGKPVYRRTRVVSRRVRE